MSVAPRSTVRPQDARFPRTVELPESLAVPAELITLQLALDTARTAVAEHCCRVQAHRRALHPGPGQALARTTWSPAERRELAELLAAEATAEAALAAHPLLVRARAEGTLPEHRATLRRAVLASRLAICA